MKSYASLIFPLSALLFLIASCREDQEGLEGCTDPEAINYDPGALVADSSACDYPEEPEELLIWREGENGEYDGEEFLGVINISPCEGLLDTMTLNPNDTLDPGPFSMIVERDSNDRFGLVATLTNPRDLSGYSDGELVIELLDPDSTRSSFEFRSFVHGKICNHNHVPCENVCISRYVNVSTQNLNDSTMRTVRIPVPDFDEAYFDDTDHVMGIRGDMALGSDTVLAVREIRLVP